MKTRTRTVVIEPYWIQVIRHRPGKTVWNRYKVGRASWMRITEWMLQANHGGTVTLNFGHGRIVIGADR